MSEDVSQKRIELIRASEEKKIKNTVKFLTKCEDEDILRIHKEFKDKENEKVIDALCVGILSKGAHLLEYLHCVPDRCLDVVLLHCSLYSMSWTCNG